MKPKRLSREEGKEQTRQHLLDAARAIYSRKGFAAASVEDIAGEAGYTRGAFYSNFASKTELILALLKQDLAEFEHESVRAFDPHQTRKKTTAASFGNFRRLNFPPESNLLWAEAKLHAARDTRFRELFSTLLQRKKKHTAACILSMGARAGYRLPLPAETLAVGLLALCEGLHSWHAADPAHMRSEHVDAVMTGFLALIEDCTTCLTNSCFLNG